MEGLTVDFSDVERVFHDIEIDRLEHKQLAFISSAYRGDIAINKAKAREYAKIAISRGYIPVVPHLWLTEILDDNIKAERELGLEMCLELVARCDVFLLCGDVSGGMAKEHEKAIELQKKVIIIF